MVVHPALSMTMPSSNRSATPTVVRNRPNARPHALRAGSMQRALATPVLIMTQRLNALLMEKQEVTCGALSQPDSATGFGVNGLRALPPAASVSALKFGEPPGQILVVATSFWMEPVRPTMPCASTTTQVSFVASTPRSLAVGNFPRVLLTPKLPVQRTLDSC